MPEQHGVAQDLADRLLDEPASSREVQSHECRSHADDPRRRQQQAGRGGEPWGTPCLTALPDQTAPLPGVMPPARAEAPLDRHPQQAPAQAARRRPREHGGRGRLDPDRPNVPSIPHRPLEHGPQVKLPEVTASHPRVRMPRQAGLGRGDGAAAFGYSPPYPGPPRRRRAGRASGTPGGAMRWEGTRTP
jgi:hypothetical protein